MFPTGGRPLTGPTKEELAMRPLLELPKWDGKLVLAGIFLLGYYGIVWIAARRDIPAANVQLIRDQLVVLGPVIGLIFGALFRNTAAEERKAANDAQTLQKAIETPSTVVQPVGTGNGSVDALVDAMRERTDEDPEILK